MIKVSKKGLSNREPLQLIKLSYLLNKEKFTNEFDKVKVKVGSESELEDLANIAVSKLDISGRIKENSSGTVVMFDTMRILGNMTWTKAEKESVMNNPDNFEA